MYRLTDILGAEEGNTMVVVGGGSTIKERREKIINFLDRERCSTIAINKIIPDIIPTYHLWTNTQRYTDHGDSVKSQSKLIFGEGLSKNVIYKHYPFDNYILAEYTFNLEKAKKEKIGFKGGRIKGFFRTAGCLAIMICHLLKASKIYVVGMDGYTLHSKEDMDSNIASHHCYGVGYTDSKDWEYCKYKDDLVYKNLIELREYGITFHILTETVFKEFRDINILGDD